MGNTKIGKTYKGRLWVMGIDSDLIRGHIDTIILKILFDGDKYGYEICKDVEEKSGNITFTVTGSGHGVGMSQYGANYIAKQGKSYKEILNNYYVGTQIRKNK